MFWGTVKHFVTLFWKGINKNKLLSLLLLFSVGPKKWRLTSAASLLQVRLHAVIVREHRRSGTNLGSHVTDSGHSWRLECKRWMLNKASVVSPFLAFSYVNTEYKDHAMFFFCLTSARDGINSRSMILHNCTSATLHSQDASHLQDDILWRGPTWQGSCQLHSNHLTD